MVKKPYWKRVLISLDQLINVVFLNGDEDETISSRLGKRQRKGCKFSKFICKILSLVDKDHCRKSIERDEGKSA